MALVATSTAEKNPKVKSVALRSLSIVFGTPTMGTPSSSCRRLAAPRVPSPPIATSASRRSSSPSGAGTSEAEIDIYFGWQEKVLLKAMQRHYEAMSVASRMTKAKITSGM